MRDLIVVGGGPAGLATAAEAARRGLDALVLERRTLPADKACGEGILPAGVRALEALGARPFLDPGGVAPLRTLRWVQEDGTFAAARLPPPGGLGVRRLALSAGLRDLARARGAEVRDGVPVEGHRRHAGGVTVRLGDGEEVEGRILVAADGLASAVREREGLGRPAPGARRFGLRRHLAVASPGDAVEVHFTPDVEAYLTPAGPGRVGLAFLFEEGVAPDFRSLLSRFPALEARLGAAPLDSAVAGAGPLSRRASSRVEDRLVLAGDAAGYVDAITGEGVSLALEEALLLGEALPGVLSAGATRDSLLGWERAARARRRRHAAVTRLVLSMARRPRLRHLAIAGLGRAPALFDGLLARAVG